MLFISHFDEDHTNGLEYLTDKGTIDSDTYVVVPFSYPLLIMAMESDFPSMAKFIERAIDRKVNLIGIRGGSLERRPERFNRDEKHEQALTLDNDNLFTIWDIEGKKPLWYYYPFMTVEADSLQEEFIRKISDSEELNDLDLNNAKDVIANKEKLKEIYKGIGKTQNSVTRINVNSLLMLSLPAIDVVYRWFSFMGYGVDADVIKYTPGDYEYLMNEMRCKDWITGPVCLYTGDSVITRAKIRKYGLDVINRVKELSGLEAVHLMQIPHHGSRDSFTPSLLSDVRCGVDAVFINGNPNRKIYRGYREHILEAAKARMPLHIVSTFFQSRIEMFGVLR